MEIKQATTYPKFTPTTRSGSGAPLMRPSATVGKKPLEGASAHSRDSFSRADASSQETVDHSKALQNLAIRGGHFAKPAHSGVALGAGLQGGPYRHDWANSSHSNNDPADAIIAGRATVRTSGALAQSRPVQLATPPKKTQMRKPVGVTLPHGSATSRNSNVSAGTVRAGSAPRRDGGYPPNHPENRKTLANNITDASVLSAQNRDSETRWQTYETMLAKQNVAEGSDLHSFNLGATGAAFHFDVNALVKYAGDNHDLITPEAMTLVRRGYVYASAKPK